MATTNKEKQIQNLIRRTIVESVAGILSNPDYGMEISSDTAKRLKKYSSKTSLRATSLKDLKKKYS